MVWAMLAVAIVAEVTATLALRASEGLSRLWPSLLVLSGYLAAFVLLSKTLKHLPVGPVYAIWSGVGIVGATIGGIVLYSEHVSWQTVVGMTVVIVGVAIVSLSGVGHRV